jgi:N-methylhydantoinase A
MLRISTDIGGTFTDLIAFDEETKGLVALKVSTSPEILPGLIACLEKLNTPLEMAGFFLHGSTIAINTVIERKGARVALLATKGFEDVLEIGRGNIPNSFDLVFSSPVPLIPRSLRMGIRERTLYNGKIQTPLNVEEARRKIQSVLENRVEAIAICLLHSYANSAHELALEKIINDLDSSCFVSVSSRILGQYREYERTSTAVLNAYVGPKVDSYLRGLQVYLQKSLFRGNSLIMQSNGGTMALEVARLQPCRTMESGPVSGTIGAAHLGQTLGFTDVISFDMGGTTAKVSTIQNGEVTLTDAYYIGGYEMGYPLQLPVVDILEVGSGGGSIANVSETGALKVGPISAGATPGPACYRKGNTRPTVTDANLVLGRLNPDYFLGGEIILGVKEAMDAIDNEVARPLGMDKIEAASGIVKLADNNMANAVRVMTVERGYDPRDSVLVAYGGAGPCHAVSVADELEIKKVVIPKLPAHFSAYGMLLADVKHEFVQSYVKPLAEIDVEEVASIYANLEKQGWAVVKEEKFAETDVKLKRMVEMRYLGQEFTLTVPVVDSLMSADRRADLKNRFDQIYKVRYAHSFPEAEAELVSIRLEIYGVLPKPDLRLMWLSQNESQSHRIEEREVYFNSIGFHRCKIYKRTALRPGERVEGPAIVEELASTTVLHPGNVMTVDELGNMIIDLERT